LPSPMWCLIAGMRVPHVPNAAAWTMKTAHTLTRARRSCVSGKCFALDGGEALRDLVCERAGVVDQFVGKVTCALEERTITPKLSELQVGQARLARSQQLAAAAELEVDLGEVESVSRSHERLETSSGGIRQLFARARDQQAKRLLCAAADATAE